MRRNRIWNAARSASFFVALVFLLLQIVPAAPWVALWLSEDWPAPKGDVLIVLGADQLGDGTIGLGSYWRCVYGVRTWRQGGFRKVVFSAGPGGYPESGSLAAEMGRFSAALGIPPSAILLEERSTSTRENALFTAALLRNEPGPKVLVTSEFHMRRALGCFRKVGLDVKPVPHPDIGKQWSRWTQRPGCNWAVAVELVKLVYYRVQGWI